jgi:hypothetical protein
MDEHELTGVVDWPAAASGGLPVLDLLHLEVSSIRERTGQQLGPVLRQHALPGLRAGGSEIFRTYCRRLGLEYDRDQRKALAAAYWLQAITHELFDPDRDPDQAADPEWRRENITDVLRALTGNPRWSG